MPQKAMGTTISFQQNSQTVRIGALRSISEIKADSEAIDVTTLDAAGGCKQYIIVSLECQQTNLHSPR